MMSIFVTVHFVSVHFWSDVLHLHLVSTFIVIYFRLLRTLSFGYSGCVASSMRREMIGYSCWLVLIGVVALSLMATAVSSDQRVLMSSEIKD